MDVEKEKEFLCKLNELILSYQNDFTEAYICRMLMHAGMANIFKQPPNSSFYDCLVVSVFHSAISEYVDKETCEIIRKCIEEIAMKGIPHE